MKPYSSSFHQIEDDMNTYLNPPDIDRETCRCTSCGEEYAPSRGTIENDINGTYACSDCRRNLSDSHDTYVVLAEQISWHITWAFEDDPHRQGIDLNAISGLREKLNKVLDDIHAQALKMGGVK